MKIGWRLEVFSIAIPWLTLTICISVSPAKSVRMQCKFVLCAVVSSLPFKERALFIAKAIYARLLLYGNL